MRWWGVRRPEERKPAPSGGRCVFVLVDDDCKPIHVIEYQGGGHFKGAHHTAARDAVKKEALRRAGIGYVEVVAGDTPAELRRVVERLVRS